MVAFRLEDPATTMSLIIDTNIALADGSRATGHYDNSPANEGNLWFVPYLTVQYDAGPPTAGDTVAELYLLPGSAEGIERYPAGGTGVDPQPTFFIGDFTTVSPSTTVDEILGLPATPLYPSSNRFVLKNVSGQTFDSTWQLEMMVYRMQDE